MRIRNDKGFTLIELLIVVAIIGIIAAIAVPGLMKARQSGSEASAIGSLSAINKGQASYAATCGNNYFVSTLQDLGTGNYISPDLGAAGADTVHKSGYAITMGAATALAPAQNGCNGKGLYTGYHATATPDANATTSRYFATNGAGTIYNNTGAAMTVGDDAITGGVPIQ